MLTFKPALWRTGTSWSPPSGVTRTTTVNSGQLFYLPAPVKTFGIPHESKAKIESLVTKAGGNKAYNNKYAVSQITITGDISISSVSESGTQLADDEDMFELYRDLVSFLDTSAEFEVFMYYDSTTPKYRKFKKLVLASMNTDIGDNNRTAFPYTIQLHRMDPVIYTTAPGA